MPGALSDFKLHVPAFIGAMAVGLLFVYLGTPHRKVVISQPTPSNAGKVVYEDEHDNCFVMDAHKVKCSGADNIVDNIVGSLAQ